MERTKIVTELDTLADKIAPHNKAVAGILYGLCGLIIIGAEELLLSLMTPLVENASTVVKQIINSEKN